MESHGYQVNFAASRGDHWWFAARRRVLDAVLGRTSDGRAGTRLLDYGAGTGANIPLFSQFGSVCAVEPSPEARALARRDGLTLVSPEELPAGGGFDWVAAIDVIEHVPDDVALLADLGGRLKPGGRALITVPAFHLLWSENDWVAMHHRRYTSRGLAATLERAGFSIEWMSYWNSLLLPAVGAVALRDRLRRRFAGPPPASSMNYVDKPPAALNRLLFAAVAWEAALFRRGGRLPAGVSLIAVARKSGSGDRPTTH